MLTTYSYLKRIRGGRSVGSISDIFPTVCYDSGCRISFARLDASSILYSYDIEGTAGAVGTELVFAQCFEDF